METESLSETLLYLNHLPQLSLPEDYIELSCPESFKTENMA